ncbi:NADPH-dependent FMN reductase [Lentzea sp. HUAS TT2]|uniref:NADPH-dependent FMN reductase n=1 Tax=Lentzea sp. HUAS TT2 TaxID=3447454 RepID=UPI003F718F7D
MTAEPPLHLALIIGSTREGRFGTTVAGWVLEHVQQRGDVTVDVIDLAEVPLPTVQQSVPVITGVYPSPDVQAFAQRIGAADGFVVVTPEYNHGYPASLKLAIDSVYVEWNAKPVAFVSYGGLAGGSRAVEQLRQVFAELHATTIRETICFAMAHSQFGQDGRLLDPDGPDLAAKSLLDQLTWWAGALRDKRAKHAYNT